MVLSIAFCVVGLALVTWSADQFVIGAARIAIRLDVSAVVVGAVIVGFGTSAPELLVSTSAAARDDIALGVGNIVGSNVANLSLVLGATALITPVVVHSATLRREAPLSLAAAGAFVLLARNGISRADGVLFTILLVSFLGFILLRARQGGFESALTTDVDEVLEGVEEISLGQESGRTLLGLAGTVGGAQMLVEGALDIADRAGVSSGFIGLTLVAIGTSLPELVTAVMAARKGATDLIVGNLLGSNVFNSLAVSGAMGLVGPGPIGDDKLASTALGIMMGVAVLGVVFMMTNRTVVRWEAAALLLLYAGTIPLLA